MDPLIGLDFSNFQSLKDTKLNLDPGLNVVIGPSNLGKSAAIRGLKALVRNAPAPGLIREGTKEFSVTAWFADGQKIELVKGKNKSEYWVNGDCHAKSGANSVPRPVLDIWNIAAPDGRELSFASQHEPPFLLAEPASATAKVLGDLTNAAVLMEAVAAANKLRTQALADEKARTREADEAREELLSHAGLSIRTKALERAREALSVAETAVGKWRLLCSLWDEHVQLSEQFSENEQTLKMNTNLNDLLDATQTAVDRLQALAALEDEHEGLLSQLWQANTGIANNADQVKSLETQIHALMGDSCPLCGSSI